MTLRINETDTIRLYPVSEKLKGKCSICGANLKHMNITTGTYITKDYIIEGCPKCITKLTSVELDKIKENILRNES